MAGLNKRRALFVREYLTDMNGSRAAIAAGYSKNSAHVAASRLLRNAKVQAEIEEVVTKKMRRLEISAEYVLGTIKETIERARRAVPVLDKEGEQVGIWKEDSSAVLKGCELLGKYLGLFTEKIKHSVEHVDLSQLSDGELAEIQRILESAQGRKQDRAVEGTNQ